MLLTCNLGLDCSAPGKNRQIYYSNELIGDRFFELTVIWFKAVIKFMTATCPIIWVARYDQCAKHIQSHADKIAVRVGRRLTFPQSAGKNRQKVLSVSLEKVPRSTQQIQRRHSRVKTLNGADSLGCSNQGVNCKAWFSWSYNLIFHR